MLNLASQVGGTHGTHTLHAYDMRWTSPSIPISRRRLVAVVVGPSSSSRGARSRVGSRRMRVVEVQPPRRHGGVVGR